MTARLYTAYHRAAPLIQSPSVVPIHVGRALAPTALPGMIGDDGPGMLSEQNPAFCELTALYWAWKQDQTSSHLGLMHYRRLLDLTGLAPEGPVEAHPATLDLADWGAGVERWLEQQAPDVDLVVPRLHVMGRSLAENYRGGHQPQDWDLARTVVAQDFPDWLESFDRVAARPEVRLGNMMLMRRALFERYCGWLFAILFKVAKAPVDRSLYSPRQSRYLGYLAERLLTVFVHHLQSHEPGLEIREVSILNLEHTAILPWLPSLEEASGGTPEQGFHDQEGREAAKPTEEDRTVHVALAADRAYLPHATAMLRSLLDHADPTRDLALYLLHDAIPAKDLSLLADLVAGWSSEQPERRPERRPENQPENRTERRGRAQLVPIDTAGAFAKSYRSASRAPSNVTYNRFLLFSLLPGLPRLVYLDCDMIIRRDICALYDTDIAPAWVAGVPDWIMTRTLSGPVPTADPDIPDLGAYQRNTLDLSPEAQARYVNAGVLLFDFAAMEDPVALGRTLMREAREGRYLFRDQDILNRVLKDRLHLLDGRWNVFNSRPEAYDRVPGPLHAQAMTARREPWVLHYADQSYKPWGTTPVPGAELYWQALIRTPFYSEVLAGLKPHDTGPARRLYLGLRTLGLWLITRAPGLRRPLLWLHAQLKSLKTR